MLQVQKEFTSALVPSPEAIEKIGQYFYKKTSELISAGSYSLIHKDTKGVNIVDVLKLVPIYWAASEIVRLLRPNNVSCTVFLMANSIRLVYHSRINHTNLVYTLPKSCTIYLVKFTSKDLLTESGLSYVTEQFVDSSSLISSLPSTWC